MNHNVKILHPKGSTEKSVAYGDVRVRTYPEHLEVGTLVEFMLGTGTYVGEITDKPTKLPETNKTDKEIKKVLSEPQPILVVCV